ncbi:MAG: hypothetical protein WED07_14835 [Candidatus Freyarchaeum deiterrae]
MEDICLSSLRKLLNEIESGKLIDVNGRLGECWEELSLREKDPSIPPEIITRSKEILEKLTEMLREYKERPINEENLHEIRSKIFEEQPKQGRIHAEFSHTNEEDILDMISFLEKIELKMKKGDFTPEETKSKKVKDSKKPSWWSP